MLTGVVVATRDRRASLLRTLAHLEALPERPPIVVVDNGSRDGTADAVHEQQPDVEVIRLAENAGGAARSAGARALDTPLVAFSDDDSWWEPGALEVAARAFERHPRLGLLCARILVGPDERLDPTCAEMHESPLPPDPTLPGPPVLGFLACGAVVRREAFLAVGGFDRRLGIGGEELLLALDLAAAGWGLAYVDGVVAHHHPASGGRGGRRAAEVRNLLWTIWLRRPPWSAASRTAAVVREALAQRSLRGLMHAARGLPWVLRERRVVPPEIERSLRRLETARP